MSDDERPVAWRGMASFDSNDDSLLCPRPAGPDYYPGPAKPKNAWEVREAEGMMMDPKTMTLKRREELQEERRWQV